MESGFVDDLHDDVGIGTLILHSSPRPSSEMFRRIEARDFDSYLRKVSQRTSSRETSQPVDNLSSSQKDQVDVRSRKMTLGGEISETPSHQREQDKNKGMEPSSVSEEKIASLRSLVASLKENPEARPRLKKMLSDKKSGRRLQAIPVLVTSPTVLPRCVFPCSRS